MRVREGRRRISVQLSVLLFLVLFFRTPVGFAGNIHFAHIPDGGGFSTTFTLVNTGISTAAGTLRFFSPDGAPRAVPIKGVARTEVPVTILAGGSVRLKTDNMGEATGGWATFESADSVGGVATFDLRGIGNSLITTASVLGSKAYRLADIPVETGSSTNTGIAIANVSGSAPVSIVLHLLAETGSEVAAVSDPRLTPLGARRQVADFASSLFARVQGISNFQGSIVVQVVGAGEVSVTGLIVKEGLLSALPVMERSALPELPPPPPPDYY